MNKLSLLVLAVILWISCNHEAGQKNTGSRTDSVAAAAYENYLKAAADIRFTGTRNHDSLHRAIAMLDSAIMIDSDNPKAYLSKNVLQMLTGDYEGAMKTLATSEGLLPGDPEIKSTMGLLLLMHGDRVGANVSFRKSDSLLNLRLDTVSRGNEWGLLSILISKVTNLKLLGDSVQAKETCRRILALKMLDMPEYHGLRQIIDTVYLNKTSEEYYDYIVQGLPLGTLSPYRRASGF